MMEIDMVATPGIGLAITFGLYILMMVVFHFIFKLLGDKG